MQHKIIQGILFSIHTDTLYKGDYGLILTNKNVEKIKFPASFKNFKESHLMQMNMVCEVELVKTKKNWIVSKVISSQIFYTPLDYQDFLAFTQCIVELKSNLRENQDTLALFKILDFFQNRERVQASQFQRELLGWLGF
jgi:hypothetical protein